jgi:hypothetical protein
MIMTYYNKFLIMLVIMDIIGRYVKYAINHKELQEAMNFVQMYSETF